MSTDVLQRVMGLIRLSTSDNENEARTAALAACRLIVQRDAERRLEKIESQIKSIQLSLPKGIPHP